MQHGTCCVHQPTLISLKVFLCHFQSTITKAVQKVCTVLQEGILHGEASASSPDRPVSKVQYPLQRCAKCGFKEIGLVLKV